MRLSKASAYGVFGAIFIAEHDDNGPVQGKNIAQAYDIPHEYLLKILQRMVKRQVLVSESGRRGGFLLRKPANQTNILEIIEAVEGPFESGVDVREDSFQTNESRDHIESICSQITEFTKALLEETTIRQLVGANHLQKNRPRREKLHA